MIAIRTERYYSDYYADVLVPADADDAPVVLLWHGITPNTRAVMRPLAVALANRGAIVIVPDWSPTSEDGGRTALRASVDWTVEQARDLGTANRRCLIGWSRGARAALGYVLDRPHSPFQRVVGLAGQYAIPIATAGRPPLELAEERSDAQVLLLHGTRDTILPFDGSQRLHDALREAGTASEILAVDTDHAGVILARFDDELQACLPERSLTTGERATLDAISQFVFRPL
ncbi:MAG: alpha/beta hydrolase [Acidimicrobiia bacterium]